jgi:hypothetical protein
VPHWTSLVNPFPNGSVLVGTINTLEHLHTMESRIHTNEILKKEEMLFMYAPGVEANLPKIQNFLLELDWRHRLLQATLAPQIGDTTACP